MHYLAERRATNEFPGIVDVSVLAYHFTLFSFYVYMEYAKDLVVSCELQ